MTTIHDVHPWYLRDQDGQATGLSYTTEEDARAAAAARPGHTVHQETADRAGAPSFGVTEHTRPVPSAPVRGWKPRGFGGTD